MLLGYACLVGSCFRSVPQILKILQTGSAEGLSLTSNLMELLCYTVTVAYNMQQVGRARGLRLRNGAVACKAGGCRVQQVGNVGGVRLFISGLGRGGLGTWAAGQLLAWAIPSHASPRARGPALRSRRRAFDLRQ